jgi:hypothetical protein
VRDRTYLKEVAAQVPHCLCTGGMALQGKIASSDAIALIAGANDSIACIQELSA